MNYLEIKKDSDFNKVFRSSIFIGNTSELIMEEIANNMWALSISGKYVKKFETSTFLTFFEKLQIWYQEQLKALNVCNKAIFYAWFDQQACQLRFNLISGVNEKLPFGSQVYLVENLSEIVADFLNSPYHDGIPWEELELLESEDDWEDDNEQDTHILKVFKSYIEAKK